MHKKNKFRLSREEEYKLVRQWRRSKGKNKAVFNTLFLSCYGLVVSVAKKFRFSAELGDLIQEGSIGLYQAIKRFDPKRGCRLTTYSRWWIRAYILTYTITHHGVISMGTTRVWSKMFFNFRRVRAELEREGKETTLEAIACKLNLPLNRVEEMLPRFFNNNISLDAPVFEEGAIDFSQVVAKDQPTPEEFVAEHENNQRRTELLGEMLKVLNPFEFAVVEARFLSEDRITLAEYAKRVNLSRERIRQIEEKALKKLRRASVFSRFRGRSI